MDIFGSVRQLEPSVQEDFQNSECVKAYGPSCAHDFFLLDYIQSYFRSGVSVSTDIIVSTLPLAAFSAPRAPFLSFTSHRFIIYTFKYEVRSTRGKKKIFGVLSSFNLCRFYYNRRPPHFQAIIHLHAYFMLPTQADPQFRKKYTRYIYAPFLFDGLYVRSASRRPVS